MPPRVALVLGTAIAAVSAAGVLVRLAPDAHPLVLAFWRTAVVSLVLLPAARRLPARELLWVCLAGALLAFHFWAWFASLRLTTVLRSTVLVCLTPVWAGLGEALWLRARPRPRYWIGVGVALVGVGGLAGAGGTADLAGDLLAVLGGLLSASYLLIGRSVRPRVDIATYGATVCGAAAVTLLVLGVALGVDFVGLAGSTWLAIAGMALGPQLIGHIGFNYAVRYVPAAVVGAVILLEPVGATALAAVLLDELPRPSDLIGGAAILVGVGVAVWGGSTAPPAPSPAPGG